MNTPVQTLDSLNGIDADRVPEPAETFRADVASLRMAIAVGAEAVTHANLLPASIRESRETRTAATRAVAALAAGVLIVIGWHALVSSSSGGASEVRDLERRIAVLEPQSVSRAGLQRASTIGCAAGGGTLGVRVAGATTRSSPRAALERHVRVRSPLTAIDVQADGGYWRTTIQGLAVTGDVAAGQSAVNRLLFRLSESPLVGPVVQPPSFRLISGAPSGRATAAGETRPIPDGMSGVEFAMQFRSRVPR